MTPKELREANIARFEGLLTKESDPDRRRMLDTLLAEERLKDESCYPAEAGPRGAERDPTGLI